MARRGPGEGCGSSGGQYRLGDWEGSSRRVVLPADAPSAYLGVGDASTSRGTAITRRPRVRRARQVILAQRRGGLGQDGEVGEDLTRRGSAGPDPLQAAVGVGEGAVFLGVGLERKDDVGPGARLVFEHREGRRRNLQRRSRPPRRCCRGSRGVGQRQREAGTSAPPTQGRRGSPRYSSPTVLRAETRAGVGEAACLAQAAGVAHLGYLKQARSGPARRGRVPRRGRAGPAPLPHGAIRSPQMITTRSALRSVSASSETSSSSLWGRLKLEASSERKRAPPPGA